MRGAVCVRPGAPPQDGGGAREVIRREMFVHTLRQWRSVSGTPSTNERQKKTRRPVTMLNAVFTGVATEPASPAASGPRVCPAGFMSRRGRPGEALGRGTRPATTPRRARRRGRRTRRNMTKSNQGNRYRRRSSRGNQPAGQRGKRTDAEPPEQQHRPDYSPQQREQVREGLRILARLIARAHLRRQKGAPRPE